jgi:hypothetical protein
MCLTRLGLLPWQWRKLTPREYEMLCYRYLLERERELDSRSELLAYIVAYLGEFKKGQRPSPKKLFSSFKGRGYLSEFQEGDSEGKKWHPDNEAKKKRLAQKARERCQHLKGREPGAVIVME